jgi:glycosyltransferase involved in cell wall biosynthesis
LAFHQQLFLPLLDSAYFNSIEKNCPIDVIHLHGHRHILNNLVLQWAKKRGIPYVFTANGTLRRHERKIQVKKYWDALISGYIPKEANACIAVSQTDRSYHLQQGIPSQKIHVIPNGLDLLEFSQRPLEGFKRTIGIPLKDRVVLYLGRISPRKGVDILVESFKRLKTTHAHLVVAGSDMGGLNEAKRLACSQSNIHFINTISGTLRLQALRESDLVVYPSKDEIFGLVPFEALMSGTPTIVSDDCGCGEIIQLANAGTPLPYGNIPRLTEEIDGLLSAPERCRDMVERGQAYIKRHLGFDSVAHQHVTLYQQVKAA